MAQQTGRSKLRVNTNSLSNQSILDRSIIRYLPSISICRMSESCNSANKWWILTALRCCIQTLHTIRTKWIACSRFQLIRWMPTLTTTISLRSKLRCQKNARTMEQKIITPEFLCLIRPNTLQRVEKNRRLCIKNPNLQRLARVNLHRPPFTHKSMMTPDTWYLNRTVTTGLQAINTIKIRNTVRSASDHTKK